MRERFSQFVQLLRIAVQFQSDQVGDLECFSEQRTDVVQMSKNAFGISVAFAAENFIALDSEPVEEILLLALSFLNERWKCSFELFEFSRVHLKVRMKSNEVRQWIHSPSLFVIGKCVEPSLTPIAPRR